MLQSAVLQSAVLHLHFGAVTAGSVAVRAVTVGGFAVVVVMLEQWAVGVGPEGAVGVGAEGLSVTERRVLLVLEQRAWERCAPPVIRRCWSRSGQR